MPFADDYTIPLPAMYIDSVDPAVTYTDGRVKAGRLWLDTSTGTIGTLKKRNAANNGWDTLIDLDAAAATLTTEQVQDIVGAMFSDGDVDLTYDDPSGVITNIVTQARGLRETAGPATLTMGAVADGEFLKRDGSTVIGATPSGGIGGSTGSTDNAVLRADGTGGSTAQASSMMIADDLSGEVGYINIPQNSQSANYTAVLADRGKHLFHPSSDNNPRTFTIPANASVAYPVGTAITFVNKINTLTIAITSDTLTWAEDGTTGSRTLAANGIATALKITSTEWLISGTGLS